MDNQLDSQPKMSLPFCHPSFSLCSSGTPANIRAKMPGRAEGQSSRLPRHALGFLHNHIPARTGQQPVTDAAPYSLPLEDILRGISQCLWVFLLFRYFPSERDNGLQNLDLRFLSGKRSPFPFLHS